MNKKQNASRPKEFLILLLLIAALTANVLYWGGKKEGYHTDEMFSYAQIGDTEYWRIWFDRPGEPYLNYWHDPSYYETFLTVSADEAFDLAGAWNTACDNDAHPPLYFVMLDLVTSLFFQDDYTKWSGLVTNLPFYVLSLLLVYLSGKKLFGGRFLPSAVGMLFFGGCVGVVSIAIYIQMYMIAVFFSALLFYVHCLLYYISNVFPEICLISCYIAYHAVGWFTSSRSCRAAALCILVLLGGLGYLQTGVSYLYLGCSEQLSLLQHFPDHRAIVVTDVDSDCANLAPYLLESSAVYQSHVENISALYPGFHAAPSEIVILYINYQNPDLTIGQIASNVKDGLRAKNILNLFHTVGTQTCEVYALSFD